jgi:putative DNA primase/helicase
MTADQLADLKDAYAGMYTAALQDVRRVEAAERTKEWVTLYMAACVTRNARRKAFIEYGGTIGEAAKLHEGVDGTPANDGMVNTVPEAKRLCSDQANAQRLQRHYEDQLLVSAGVFYAWSETHWKINNGRARLLACNLSRIVQGEADLLRVDADAARNLVSAGALEFFDKDPKDTELLERTPEGVAYLRLLEKVTALDKWATRCEMAAVQDAALRILKDLLAIDSALLDADAFAFNCLNGTVDLTTGKLRPHSAADLITKIAPTIYEATATCPRFREFLSQIFKGDAAVLDFVQRFYGYAITGATDEQILLILWGEGGNGKSTLVEAIAGVIGDYASPAPTGLLTGKTVTDNNYYAEIADLHGRRLVTASESEEGAKLKEAFIKKATGGDTLKGRHLFGQLFGFKPTHTLQLLTNHKPHIRGADFSIWRRIRLLPFLAKFGTANEVQAGKAKHIKDTTLPAALIAERTGILAWLVEGARLWKAGGIESPAAVLAAGLEYQTAQDRVQQFIDDCCDTTTTVPKPEPVAVDTIYQRYLTWCRAEGLDHPLTKRGLMDQLRTRVPAIPAEAFRHKKQRCIDGVALLPL